MLNIGKEMPRSEVIKACKECADAGMKPEMLIDDRNNTLIGIRCEPRETR